MPHPTRGCPRCSKPYSSSQSACADCLNAAKRAKRASAIAAQPDVPCITCGTPFRPSSSRNKSCSAGCQKLNARRLRGIPDLTEIKCAYCGSAFMPARADATHCSVRCKDRYRHSLRWQSPDYRAQRARYWLGYQALSRDALIEASRVWRESNRDHHREISRAWSRGNPARNALAKHRRRARKNGTQVCAISTASVAEKIKYWGGKCWMCLAAADTLDHVKPLAAGGYHMLANLRPACRSCNSSKGAKWYGPENLSMFIRLK